MLYIKIQNVIYKNPIFAPPAGPKSPKLYIKTTKVIYNGFLKRSNQEFDIVRINYELETSMDNVANDAL